MPSRTAPTVRDFMTPAPYFIGPDRPLSEAHARMREHRIRHLPVLQGGRLLGIVSQRDLHLIETLRDVDPTRVEVSEAMSTDPYVVSPDAPLEKVAAHMWAQKVGSAVVVDKRSVVGMFTTVDALGALITLLARQRAPRAAQRGPAAPKPSRRGAVRRSR